MAAIMNGHLLRKVALSALLIAGFPGCRPSDGDLVGRYIASYDDGSLELQLKADGTYLQTARVKGTVASRAGHWTREKADRVLSSETVTLREAIVLGAAGNRVGDWREHRWIDHLSIGREWLVGEVRLGAEDYHPYRRVGP